MKTHIFFNTARLEGEELQKATGKAYTQNEAVYEVYRYVNMAISPSHCKLLLESRTRMTWLITSVRRAISTLTKEGRLQKTDIKVPSPYRSKEHLWKVN